MKQKIKVGDVVYEVKQRARYCDGFRCCSGCGVWVRREDLQEVDRCPFCNRRLRIGGLNRGEKKYISISVDLEE